MTWEVETSGELNQNGSVLYRIHQNGRQIGDPRPYGEAIRYVWPRLHGLDIYREACNGRMYFRGTGNIVAGLQNAITRRWPKTINMSLAGARDIPDNRSAELNRLKHASRTLREAIITLAAVEGIEAAKIAAELAKQLTAIEELLLH